MVDVECHLCKTKFQKTQWEVDRTKNNFCSRKCSNTFYRSKNSPNPPKFLTCTVCGNEYTRTRHYRSRVFCQSCRAAKDTVTRGYPRPTGNTSEIKEHYTEITLKQLYSQNHLKGKHPSWLNAQVRGFARSWNKPMTKLPCATCGYAIHVELCHKIAISDFPLTATLGEINDPSNLIQLCRNHHWEYDHGILTI